MCKNGLFNPILYQAPKQYLETAKHTYICDKIYIFLYYSSIKDSLNCFIVNRDFKAVNNYNINLQYHQKCSNKSEGLNNLSLHDEIWHVRISNQLFILTFSFPLETPITKQLHVVYL